MRCRPLEIVGALSAAAWVLACCTAEQPPFGTAASAACREGAPRPSGLLLAGSGTNLALAQALAEAYQEANDRPVHVADSIGSGGAIRALRDGAIDIGLASRPLSESEVSLGIELHALARVPLAFATHRRVETGPLDSGRLADIFAGEVETWPDGTRIAPLLREPGDSGNLEIAKTLPALHDVIKQAYDAKRWMVCYTDQEMRDALLQVPGSVGLMDVGTINIERLPLRPIAIDGVQATAAAVAGGQYRLTKTLALLTREQSSEQVMRFVHFCRSPRAVEILTGAGYLQVAPE